MNNVLVIGDLHAPFIKNGYLEHCKEVYKQYKCNKVIFLGDILDNHYSSYWETIPDGLSAGDELKAACSKLSKWVKAFPKAVVLMGNHDRLIARKAVTAGLSSKWIKTMGDILDAPQWEFYTEYEFDNVLYVHGEGCADLRSAILNRYKSMVIGHFHTKSEILYAASSIDLLFGMSVGCGVDDKSYAMEYAKFNIKKSIIACGVVLNNGNLPIIIPMNLNDDKKDDKIF